MSNTKKILGYGVHLFTASGCLLGLLALYYIDRSQYQEAFVAMLITILIDAFDGTLARKLNIKELIKNIDGTTLDNIVDFFTYSMVPCFFLLRSEVVPEPLNFIAIACIAIASCYQFAQVDAKTDDHFFKGFPSYWNIVVFYLFYWQLDYRINLFLIIFLAVLSFVPIKFMYPSRLEYTSKSKKIQSLIYAATLGWGGLTLGLIMSYPQPSPWFNALSIAYVLFYTGFSLYRTISPLKMLKLKNLQLKKFKRSHFMRGRLKNQ